MAMAHAGRKHLGPGAQQKRAGTGGMSELPDGLVGENMVLSNRDKAQHSEEPARTANGCRRNN